jgi:hypothetical protein
MYEKPARVCLIPLRSESVTCQSSGTASHDRAEFKSDQRLAADNSESAPRPSPSHPPGLIRVSFSDRIQVKGMDQFLPDSFRVCTRGQIQVGYMTVCNSFSSADIAYFIAYDITYLHCLLHGHTGYSPFLQHWQIIQGC